MNLHHVLFFCFFSALCGGNSGINIYTGPEGGSGTINCYLTLPGNRKFFCKNECKGEDVLIQTDDVRANRGRYSIEYKGESSGRGIVSVTIRNLTQSDSGRYRCGLGGSLVPESYTDFGVRVSDELLDKNSGFLRTDTEGENVTYPCIDAVNRDRIFFCKGECKKEEDIFIETNGNRAQSGRYSIEYKEGSTFGLYVTITQVLKSDSGQYRCGYGRALSPDSSRTFSVIVVDEAQPLPNQTGPSSASVPAASTSGTTLLSTPASPENNKTSTGPSSASVPAASTSGKTLPSTPASPENTKTSTAKPLPNQTGPSSTSVPAASTSGTTQLPPPASPENNKTSTGPSSAGSTSRKMQLPPPASPENNKTSTALSSVPRPGYFLPLVVPLVFVLLAVSLLVFYQCKRKRNFEENSEEDADYVNMEVPDNNYEKWGPDSKCEDSVYQNFNPASRDQDQI
ncbi:hepatitis A virus cellular receptor 1 isoform X2 [Lates calcarifer]|uniref:Hepatitis A virus cellular receptor 1 isoform X2 n=1 Tax=Lates calcarifer TaxID=8187 RepID=A0AAJ8DQK0_LATCA|nr:hepatitis A virus cellular receptor 1 isoform X2 [Lates calcarifer]